MGKAKFVLTRIIGGFAFGLRAANGRVLVQSRIYKTKTAALNAIASVKRVAPDADLVEQK